MASLWLIYLGPLLERIRLGLPRHSIILSSVRMTRSAGKDISASMVIPSQLKPSITLNKRQLQASDNCSCIKSIDQHLLISSGTANALGTSRFNRL